MENYQIIETVLVLLLVYILPLAIFIKLSRTKNISRLMFVAISILYIVLSIFTDNLLPFIFTIFNIMLIKYGEIEDEDMGINSQNRENILKGNYNKYKFSIKTFSFYKGIKYSFFSYILFIIVLSLFQYIFYKLNIETKQQEVVEETMKGTWAMFLIAVPTIAIFAPIVEEFIFRWYLFEVIFKKRLGLLTSAILTSIIFSLVHFNINAFPVLLTLSLINCYLIHKKGYWYAVFNHSVFNSVTIFAMILQRIIP